MRLPPLPKVCSPIAGMTGATERSASRMTRSTCSRSSCRKPMMRSSSRLSVKLLASPDTLAESTRAPDHCQKMDETNPLRFQQVDERSQLDLQLAAELEALRQRTLHRRLRSLTGRQGGRMQVDGRECLLLAGANYLDLAAD